MSIILTMILGIIFQNYWSISLTKILIISVSSVCVGFFCFFKALKWELFGTSLMAFCLGMIIHFVHFEPNRQNHYLNKLQENQYYTLEGSILSVKGKNAIIELKKANNQPISGKIIGTFQDSVNYKITGKSILFHTKLNKISSPKNPYQFDFQKYMQKQNVFWKGYIFSENYKTSNNTFSFGSQSIILQHTLSESLNKHSFSSENQGIIKALLLGIRDDIHPETYQQYIDAGAIHILAISGLHIGIITLILSFLLHLILRKPQHKTLITILLICFLWAYASLTGLSASVTRSVTMFSFLSIAISLKKHQGIYDNLLIAVFISLIFNPFLLFDVGFQLSYTAVFSIITFLPIFNKLWFPKNKIVRFFYSILAVSFATQIGILPISLYYFHQFSSLFFVTNLLILPFLGGILGIGILVIFLAFFNILPSFMVVGYDFMLTLMNRIISFVASFENLVFKQIYFDYKMLIITIIAIISLGFWLHFKKLRMLFVFLGCLVFFQCILIYNQYQLSGRYKLFVFERHNSSLIGICQAKELTLLQEEEEQPNVFLNNFQSYTNTQLKEILPIPNAFSFDNQVFLIIDSDTYTKENLPKVDYILLRNSPKIHLEKLLEEIRPKLLIADGSNYTWDIKRWKNTCNKLQINFHSTQEKGYFSLEKKD